MSTANNVKNQGKPAVAKKSSKIDALAQTIELARQKAASKKHKRIVWTSSELEKLKALVSNEELSIKVIFEACQETKLFGDKSKGTIKSMAFAIRQKKELPYPIVQDPETSEEK